MDGGRRTRTLPPCKEGGTSEDPGTEDNEQKEGRRTRGASSVQNITRVEGQKRDNGPNEALPPQPADHVPTGKRQKTEHRNPPRQKEQWKKSDKRKRQGGYEKGKR